MRKVLLSGTIACLIFVASGFSAQTQGGRITGAVRDESDALIPGVPVTLTDNENRTVTLKTGESKEQYGIYAFDGVRPGTYTLRADLSGFTAITISRIGVKEGETRKFDFFLTPTQTPKPCLQGVCL